MNSYRYYRCNGWTYTQATDDAAAREKAGPDARLQRRELVVRGQRDDEWADPAPRPWNEKENAKWVAVP